MRTPAHCDPFVVHRPKQCHVCDKYAADLQQQRIRDGINFTGEYDENLMPDPATQRRSEDIINRWAGNSKSGYSEGPLEEQWINEFYHPEEYL